MIHLAAAIDPGYATMGIVVGDVVEGVLFGTHALRSDLCEHSMEEQVDRCLRMARLAFDRVLEIANGARVEALIIEDLVGGRKGGSAMTPYFRGRLDQLLECHAAQHGMLLLRTKPALCKAFCHPAGKAVDKGREKDLEFRSALNQLDSVMQPTDLRLVAEPAFTMLGETAKRWKQSRLHVLDAGALFGLLTVAQRLHYPRHPRHLQPGHRVQIPLAETALERWRHLL